MSTPPPQLSTWFMDAPYVELHTSRYLERYIDPNSKVSFYLCVFVILRDFHPNWRQFLSNWFSHKTIKKWLEKITIDSIELFRSIFMAGGTKTKYAFKSVKCTYLKDAGKDALNFEYSDIKIKFSYDIILWYYLNKTPKNKTF